MWQYRISTGTLKLDGKFEGSGYSGRDPWRNNPAGKSVVDFGPIPPGKWRIGRPYKHAILGPCVMNLDPIAGTETFARSGFRIHGDNARHDASHGCPILGPSLRTLIAASGHTVLEVVE